MRPEGVIEIRDAALQAVQPAAEKKGLYYGEAHANAEQEKRHGLVNLRDDAVQGRHEIAVPDNLPIVEGGDQLPADAGTLIRLRLGNDRNQCYLDILGCPEIGVHISLLEQGFPATRAGRLHAMTLSSLGTGVNQWA